MVGHKITKKKKKAKNKEISKWIKENRSMNVFDLVEVTNKKLIGMYAYYGINGMLEEMYKLYYHVKYIFINALAKRSQRKKDIEHILCIFKVMPIAKPKIYKDIWCWNI